MVNKPRRTEFYFKVHQPRHHVIQAAKKHYYIAIDMECSAMQYYFRLHQVAHITIKYQPIKNENKGPFFVRIHGAMHIIIIVGALHSYYCPYHNLAVFFIRVTVN